ncbi:metal ABC transporter permease [Candidatus Kapaibacterium sp.]
MLEMLQFPFIQRALVAGILISTSASFYSIFVVQRRISYIGSGLAHAAFGGVALGLLLGFSPVLTAIPFTLIVGILTVYLQEKSKISADSIIGILYSISVALGIIFLALKENYTADAYNYLFGSILTVNTDDVYISIVLFFITVFVFLMLWKNWAYATFDREMAKADRLPVLRDDYILMIMTSITIVVAIKIVGVILITAYVVIPGSFSRLISNKFRDMTFVSIAFGILTSIIGLFVSYELDLPSGAVIIVIQSIIFGFTLVLNKFRFNS